MRIQFLVFILAMSSLGSSAQEDTSFARDIVSKILEHHSFSDKRPTQIELGHRPSEQLLALLEPSQILSKEEYATLISCLYQYKAKDGILEREVEFLNAKQEFKLGSQFTKIYISQPCQISEGKVLVFKAQMAKIYGQKGKANGIEIVITLIKESDEGWQISESKIIESY